MLARIAVTFVLIIIKTIVTVIFYCVMQTVARESDATATMTGLGTPLYMGHHHPLPATHAHTMELIKRFVSFYTILSCSP